LPIPRSRARPQASEEDEEFDVNIPGSDDPDEENDPPVRHSRARGMPETTGATKINDPGVTAQSKTTAADVRYFFEREESKTVCKECK
jgi:hypothetical protein